PSKIRGGGMDQPRIAFQGQRVLFEWARSADGSSPGKDYFDSLDDADKIKIVTIWKHIGINPDGFRNEQLFRAFKGEANLQEIKARQARLFTAWAKPNKASRAR